MKPGCDIHNLTKGAVGLQLTEQTERREKITQHVKTICGQNTIIALPTTPGPAPLKGLPMAQMDDYRNRMLALTCPAGLSNLPQVKARPSV